MQNPFISVVIPTYNSQNTIDQCLGGIANQDYPTGKLEVIVVDGYSQDKTLEIVKKYSGVLNVQILLNERHVEFGKGGGKFKGVVAAKGDVVAFVDSDNQFATSNFLKLMAKPLMHDPHISMSFPRIVPAKEDGLLNRYIALVQLDKWPEKQNQDYTVFHLKDDFQASITDCALVRKKLLEKVGGFDWQMDVIMRMLKRGYNKVAFVPRAYFWHHHAGNYFTFIRKNVRHVRDFLYYRSLRKETEVVYKRELSTRPLKVFPIFSSLRKIRTNPDLGWLCLPLMTFTSFMIFLIMLLSNQDGRELLKDIIL